MSVLLQVNNLTKSFGDKLLFSDLCFGVSEGERIGLIAPNGTGKTTLLNILAGKEEYDSGEVVFRNDIRVGYLPQEPYYDPSLTVLEACFTGESEVLRAIEGYEKAVAEPEHGDMSEWIARMDHLKAWDYELRIKQILSQLKIYDYAQPIGQLSGGQLKRVALANVLISEPDLIILDEPTNHLDLEMTEWLENYLNRSRLALLMVTHDRYFLDRVCNEIIEMDGRQLYSYQGNYSYYLEKREERILAQGAEMEKARNLYRKELDWMRRQPQARATKAKARKDAFYGLEAKVKQRNDQSQVQLNGKASYIGNKIFEANHLYKSFGDKCILEDYSYVFARYEKMGIIGNNGTGKSTFIKMLIGEMQPDSGTIEVGETVRFGYYSQDGLQFDEQKRVIDVIQEIAEYIDLGDGHKLSAGQLLQHFLFAPETQYNFVYKLSGGEKRRLYLCSVLMQNPNFLVLDEPTNDLDILTLNLLEEYLINYKGCVIIVSHDRFFMDKVVDHLLVFEGNGSLRDFPGNYSDFRLWKEEFKSQQEAASKSNSSTPKERAPQKEVVADGAAKPRKLSYKEQRELESLNEEIPALEERKSEMEAKMSSGQLSSDELMTIGREMSDLIEEIEEKSMRWLELSC